MDTIGAILSGDPFVYAEIVPEVYIPYREWVLQGRNADDKDHILFPLRRAFVIIVLF